MPLVYDGRRMAPSIKDLLPGFSKELVSLLLAAGEPSLASQVAQLRIVDRCHCGDDFCATFYTQPKPHGSYGVGHRNVVLKPPNGEVILDVVHESIACVEVLYRDEIRDALLNEVP
jgi:hypothetical protein